MKKQITGMRGVYLAAAELSKHGFIASVTSRNARGVDILATDVECQRAFSIQVKTKSTGADWWNLSDGYDQHVSNSHIYLFVDIKADGCPAEFFVVPSKVVAKKAEMKKYRDSDWRWFDLANATPYRDRWDLLK
jgi:hypothetical protein